jgi:4-diphosphocytidyl-2-C-methyl-D-erythritol kinase
MTRTASTVRVPAYAKLNLGLRVLYRRPDGYHEIRTVFQTISLADRLDISFTPARTTRIAIAGTPEIPDNLIERAAHLVLEALRIQGDVLFHLKKNIPAGAGLGGGSSDAAAVLLALPVLAGKALAGKALPGDRLHAIAMQLGSDVPFFLHGGTALGMGRGEELYPLPELPAARGLLVAPEIHSSTAEAYRDLSARLTSIPLQNKLSSFQREVWRSVTGGSDVADGFGVDENDFEEVVFARHRELRRIKERLLRFGAERAAMTGSGSAIFGIFADAKELERAQKLFLNQAVFPISFVSRAQYRSAWRRALKLHVEGTLWPPRSRYAPSQSER